MLSYDRHCWDMLQTVKNWCPSKKLILIPKRRGSVPFTVGRVGIFVLLRCENENYFSKKKSPG